MHTPLPPPALERGDTLGIAAPAGPVDRDRFEAGVRLLREYGFEVKFSREITRRTGYLAGPDQARLRELHDLWADPEVKAVLGARGGYGSLRLLAGLDLELIRAYPKIFVGFSDLSVLHAAIHRHTGLITFHGPMAATLPANDSLSISAFFELLTGRGPDSVKPSGLEILRGGRARGRLLGGNLASLLHLVATPHEMRWDGAILFLEEVGEAPYRIDRMLTHLQAAGRLENVAGLILGSLEECGATETIWERVLELSDAQGLPVWANFPAGHGRENHILPLGVEVEMDSGGGRLHFLEPAVQRGV